MTSKLDWEQKARSLAERLNIQYELIQHQNSGEQTEYAVKALSEPSENILKCLLLEDEQTQQSVGTIIRGDTKLSFKAIQMLTGLKKLKFALPEYISNLTGFDLGGIPPFAIVVCDKKVVCKRIFERSYVIGAGGHNYCGAKLNPYELNKITGVEVGIISR